MHFYLLDKIQARLVWSIIRSCYKLTAQSDRHTLLGLSMNIDATAISLSARQNSFFQQVIESSLESLSYSPNTKAHVARWNCWKLFAKKKICKSEIQINTHFFII